MDPSETSNRLLKRIFAVSIGIHVVAFFVFAFTPARAWFVTEPTSDPEESLEESATPAQLNKVKELILRAKEREFREEMVGLREARAELRTLLEDRVRQWETLNPGITQDPFAILPRMEAPVEIPGTAILGEEPFLDIYELQRGADLTADDEIEQLRAVDFSLRFEESLEEARETVDLDYTPMDDLTPDLRRLIRYVASREELDDLASKADTAIGQTAQTTRKVKKAIEQARNRSAAVEMVLEELQPAEGESWEDLPPLESLPSNWEEMSAEELAEWLAQDQPLPEGEFDGESSLTPEEARRLTERLAGADALVGRLDQPVHALRGDRQQRPPVDEGDQLLGLFGGGHRPKPRPRPARHDDRVSHERTSPHPRRSTTRS